MKGSLLALGTMCYLWYHVSLQSPGCTQDVWIIKVVHLPPKTAADNGHGQLAELKEKLPLAGEECTAVDGFGHKQGR